MFSLCHLLPSPLVLVALTLNEFVEQPLRFVVMLCACRQCQVSDSEEPVHHPLVAL